MNQALFIHANLMFRLLAVFALFLSSLKAGLADSSSPRLAAYYDDFMAICAGRVYEWRNADTPQKTTVEATQVGIGKKSRYALTGEGILIAWTDSPADATVVMRKTHFFSAGHSGLLAIRADGTLWTVKTESLFGFGDRPAGIPERISNNVLTASVGDSANYYVTRDGALFVQGRAHRGQYGDGKLTSTANFVQTTKDVSQVVSHTGHALVLKRDGTVWGTGGNIYGPLGRHGYGDKAIQWGLVARGVSAIATGSSHSVAIKRDNSLWIWGRNEGPDPKWVMNDVTAVAAGNDSTIALKNGVLWQWGTGTQPSLVMKCD